MKKLWTVELQVCIGNKQPLPIPGFPALPCYVFCKMTEPLSKREAMKRIRALEAVNPGYVFTAAAGEV